MSEKRFVYEEEYFPVALRQIRDTVTDRVYDLKDITDVLNEQQTIILNLKLRLEKINDGYGHLTHKNGLTPNEWLLSKQERELKKKDEQQATIQSLKEENEQLRKELDNFKPVMFQDVRKGTVILYSKGDIDE